MSDVTLVRSIADFAGVYAYECDATAKVLARLTDASLAQKVSPNGRTLGFLAWHVVTTIPEMLSHAGLKPTGPAPDSPAPTSARAIAAAYAEASKSVVPAVRAAWKDAELGERIPMYGQEWSRGQVLGALLFHEAHHRGQMTVLMRQAGLTVPGIYGPAQEEWAAMGMPTLP